MTNLRIVPCPACRGDKGYAVPYDIDRRDRSLIEHWYPCTACEATGEIEIEFEPVELEDLEAVTPPPRLHDPSPPRPRSSPAMDLGDHPRRKRP
jgi:hypothetical protein